MGNCFSKKKSSTLCRKEREKVLGTPLPPNVYRWRILHNDGFCSHNVHVSEVWLASKEQAQNAGDAWILANWLDVPLYSWWKMTVVIDELSVMVKK